MIDFDNFKESDFAKLYWELREARIREKLDDAMGFDELCKACQEVEDLKEDKSNYALWSLVQDLDVQPIKK